MQPSEVDNMAMWEYEMFIKYLNDMVKEENDDQQKKMDVYKINDYLRMAKPSNMSKMTPKIPTVNIPKM